MNTVERLDQLLSRLEQATREIAQMLEGVQKDAFLSDIVLQRAVGMSILMASEVANQIAKKHADFVADHPEIPWREMRGMRNRIAHNYFDIDLERVWATACIDVPDLLDKLHALRHWRPQGE